MKDFDIISWSTEVLEIFFETTISLIRDVGELEVTEREMDVV